MSNEARIIDRLVDLGFRVTGPRRRVVQSVCQQSGPFSADDLYDELRADDGGVGRATVFRTLDLLVGLRLLDRVHRPDGSHCYVAGGSGHRHHLVCSSCGTVVEFHDCNVTDLVTELAQRTQFRIDGHWLEFYGICDRCQQPAS
jgi:Fur family ferric uptake transcriptional regulator